VEGLTGKKLYVPTGKDLPDWAYQADTPSSRAEEAYWRLSELIADKFGPGGATIRDIHYDVGSPLGMSSSETVELVRKAKARGYLE
jgi:hypothetical protein